MTLLLNCQSLSKSYGPRLLFRNLSLSVFQGERIGLIGPNGAGKSTLLKILIGEEKEDSGIISTKRDLKIGYLPQTCEFPDIPPEAILKDALRGLSFEDYEVQVMVDTWLSKLGFKGSESSAKMLSGGWKKRLGLAKELILSPDLLLLDEPTNHLDLEGILWLEKFLSREASTYLLVSHDRFFLENATNRIIEINPVYPEGKLAIEGSYMQFLEKKESFLLGQLEQERSMASKARTEIEWLRRSPKARTSKSKARVEDAHELIGKLSEVRGRNVQKKTEIAFSATERETRKLLVAKGLTKEIGGRTLFKGLEFTLSPGTRMGLMGPNGSGKTTLLKLLAGEEAADQGTLKPVEGLKVVYFDQHRMQLPPNITLRQALSPNGDFVNYHGQQIHVNGWCQRFLFSPDILDMSISRLSGGERARILIAHLMLQPADLLLLDEPTNDLDIPTLETLEESLLDFPGALVLITHDRCMLDRICNTFLALGDPNHIELYPEYSQWEAAQKSLPVSKAKEKEKEVKAPLPQSTKLTYQEKKELEQMETKIGKVEAEIKGFNEKLLDPLLADHPQKLQEICTQLSLAETELEQLFIRWDQLEKKQRPHAF